MAAGAYALCSRHLRQLCSLAAGRQPIRFARAPGAQPIRFEHSHAEQPAAGAQRPAADMVSAYIGSLTRWYEGAIGLSEVRAAQEAVLKAEEDFLDAQQSRRALQQQLASMSIERDRLELEMDKYQKGEDKYLQLILKEHDLIKSEQNLSARIQTAEHEERKKFGVLSTAFRHSHEKERAHSEKTKYWAVIGSVGGTLLGLLAASVQRATRARESQRNLLLADSLRRQSDELAQMTEALAAALAATRDHQQQQPQQQQQPSSLERNSSEAASATIGNTQLGITELTVCSLLLLGLALLIGIGRS